MSLKNFALAMEELNEEARTQAAAEAPVATPVEEEGDNLEAAQLAETEVAAEVAERLVELDQVEEATQDLEAVADKIEERVETEGGITEGEAEMLEVGVESICRRLGVANPLRKGGASLEAFGSRAGRRQASLEAVENVRATVAKVWGAIVAFFKKIGETIVEWFNRLFNKTKFMAKRAADLKAAAAEKDGGQKVQFSNAVFSSVGATANELKAALDLKATQEALAVLDHAFKPVQGNGDTVAAADFAIPSAEQSLVMVPAGGASTKEVKLSAGKGADWYEYCKGLQVTSEASKEKAAEAQEVDGLSSADVGAVCDTVQAWAEATTKSAGPDAVKKFKLITTQVIKFAESKARKGDKAEAAADQSKDAAAVRHIGAVAQKLATVATSEQGARAIAALKLAADSIKAPKAEKAPEAAAA